MKLSMFFSDSGAVPKCYVRRDSHKLVLELPPIERCIVVAHGTSGSCTGSIFGAPASFRFYSDTS